MHPLNSLANINAPLNNLANINAPSETVRWYINISKINISRGYINIRRALILILARLFRRCINISKTVQSDA